MTDVGEVVSKNTSSSHKEIEKSPEETERLTPYDLFLWRVYNLLEQEVPTPWGVILNLGITIFAISNIVVYVIQTDSTIMSNRGARLSLFVLECIFTAYLVLETLIRMWAVYASRKYRKKSPYCRRLAHFFTFWSVLDYAAIIVQLLYIAQFILEQLGPSPDFANVVFILRLIRIPRLMRIVRPFHGLVVFKRVIAMKWKILLISVVNMGTIILLFAMVISEIEKDVNPEFFGSVPRTMYYSVVTLATIGYGDAFPRTPGGKIWLSLFLFLPLIMFGIPVSIMAVSIVEELRKEAKIMEEQMEKAKVKHFMQKMAKLEAKMEAKIEMERQRQEKSKLRSVKKLINMDIPDDQQVSEEVSFLLKDSEEYMENLLKMIKTMTEPVPVQDDSKNETNHIPPTTN